MRAKNRTATDEEIETKRRILMWTFKDLSIIEWYFFFVGEMENERANLGLWVQLIESISFRFS